MLTEEEKAIKKKLPKLPDPEYLKRLIYENIMIDEMEKSK
jgi:hypothetical protein